MQSFFVPRIVYVVVVVVVSLNHSPYLFYNAYFLCFNSAFVVDFALLLEKKKMKIYEEKNFLYFGKFWFCICPYIGKNFKQLFIFEKTKRKKKK